MARSRRLHYPGRLQRAADGGEPLHLDADQTVGVWTTELERDALAQLLDEPEAPHRIAGHEGQTGTR